MKNIEKSVGLKMEQKGESIANYTVRTGGDLHDYSQALTGHRLELAQNLGITIEELHHKGETDLEILKQALLVTAGEQEKVQI